MTPKQGKVLIVDDEAVVRRVLRQRLSAEGYQCEEAANGNQALEKLIGSEAELVILDIKMPGRSGVEVLPEIKLGHPDTSVIMTSAISDTSTAIRCMKEGADDYITKPFNVEEVILSVSRALEKRRLQLENRSYQQHLEQMVEQRTEELKQAVSRIQLASLDTIYRLARAAEYRDEGTGAHIRRIGQYSASIARKLGLNSSDAESILYAAPMHDVGKIGIPDDILLKRGTLEADEWEIMKQHTTIGAQILRGSDAAFIKMAEAIALTHHEKWDGTGYPAGLKGSDIPIAGRIAAITDVFDALTSQRPYKAAYSIAESSKIIGEGSGTSFDPRIVEAFLAVQPEMSAVRQAYADDGKSELARYFGSKGYPPGTL